MTNAETMYSQHQGTIYAWINQTLKQFGTLLGDRDDLLSIANVEFVKAYKHYDESKSKFITWYTRCLFNRRCSLIRRQLRRDGIVKVDYTPDVEDSYNPPAPLLDLLEGMKDDARSIASLVLDAPKDLIHAMENATPRRGLLTYLTGLGWSTRRVRLAFDEVAQAL